jgi:hypothetical protein
MTNLHSYRDLDLTWAGTPPPRAKFGRILLYGLMVATFALVMASCSDYGARPAPRGIRGNDMHTVCSDDQDPPCQQKEDR